MTGTVKLSKLLIDAKVPAPARSQWPIVADEHDILWVVGLRVAEKGRITERSARVLRLRCTKAGEDCE